MKEKINPKYIFVLTMYKVLDKYLKNLGDVNDIMIRVLNEEPAFKSFIRSSFVWAKTPEGHDFWQHIANQDVD